MSCIMRWALFPEASIDKELYDAVQQLDPQRVRRALEKGANPRGAAPQAGVAEGGRMSTMTPILALCKHPEEGATSVEQRAIFELLTTELECCADGSVVPMRADEMADLNVQQPLTLMTPLMLAVVSDNFLLVDCLMDASTPPCLQAIDSTGKSAVHHAAALGRERCLRRMLEHGPRRCLQAQKADEKMQIATKQLDKAVLAGKAAQEQLGKTNGRRKKEQQKNVAKLEAEIAQAKAAYDWAATRSHHAKEEALNAVAGVESLLTSGDNNGLDPLKLASMAGHTVCVRTLCQRHELSISTTTKSGALDVAGGDAEQSKKHTYATATAFLGKDVQERLALHASLEPQPPTKHKVKFNDSKSPLHYAAMFGHIDTAKVLIEAGHDPQAKDKGLITPLLLATVSQNTSLASVLKNGVD